MDSCEGVRDWLGCPRCRHICTSRCPLEGADVVESLAREMRGVEAEDIVQSEDE